MAELMMTGYDKPPQAGGVAGKAPALRGQGAFEEGLDSLRPSSYTWGFLLSGPEKTLSRSRRGCGSGLWLS